MRHTQTKQQKQIPGKRRRLILALVVVLVVGILPGTLLLWQDGRLNVSGTGVNSANDTVSANVVCTDDRRKTYNNSFLGIGFCYPVSWGEVVVQDGKFEPQDKGSRWRILFTAKEQVALGLVSTDWSTAIPRETLCTDPALQHIPALTALDTAWRVNGDPVESALRGVAVQVDKYRIEEYVADLSTNGVCLRGFVRLAGLFPHAVATYYSEFSPEVISPGHHVNNPDLLIAPVDRGDFTVFVRSIRKL